MVGLEIRIDIEPRKRKEFLQAAESLLDDQVTLPGCMSRGIYERHGAANQFLWQEEWKDGGSLQDRLASSKFQTLLGALKVLGKTHDIRIASVERRSGGDYS